MIIRQLGLVPYLPIYQAMRQFTEQRGADTPDELWVLQHPPVYTLGMAGKYEHLLNPGHIPVEAVDRGGQVTYHGPGQLIVYILMDIKRQHYSVKSLVFTIEKAIIEYLNHYQIPAHRRQKAPGVYVADKKIAALGLRIRRGCSYHGLSLNVAMDLSPFQQINPCGYPGLAVTQLKDLGIDKDVYQVGEEFVNQLTATLGYQ